MTVRIQFRRGLASQWSSSNPILASGELGYSTDDQVIKIGDGSKTWSQLNAFAAGDISVIKASSGLTFGPETTGYGTSSAGTTSAVELQIATGGVTTSHLANSLVTTEKIANSAVTTAKINDAAVTTAKINDDAVTNAKLGLTEVKLRRTTAVSHTSAVGLTDIVWDTEDSDSSGFISASSATLTVPTGLTGLYVIVVESTISCIPDIGTLAIGYLVLNGINVNLSNYGSINVNNTTKRSSSWGSIYLVAGDTLKFQYASGGSANASGVPSGNPVTGTFRLWMTRIMD